MTSKHSKELLTLIASVTHKRARIVLNRIVKNGSITTDELKDIGYNHAPRAARDVRELGIDLKTTMVTNSNGKRMASYTFTDKPLEPGRAGRSQLPKKLRAAVMAAAGSKCGICDAEHNLQIDHRIPYAVAGESHKTETNPFQVLCGSCNRTKSWSCEHCENMKGKDPDVCRKCYWADIATYSHIAMRQERRIDLVWTGKEVENFELLRSRAIENGRTLQDELKEILQTM